MKKYFFGSGARRLGGGARRGVLRLAPLLVLAGVAPVHAQTFGPSTHYPTGGGPRSVALGDVNGDGRPDLITANSGTNTASVLLGTGAGAFGPPTDYPTGAGPVGVALGDVNGDGRPDLVTANYNVNTVSVRLNTGAGAFGPKADYPTGAEPRSVALGDVNGDGRPDLVTANTNDSAGLLGTVSVLLGTGAGAFGPKADYPTGDRPYRVALGDVNGDGRLDLVTANFGNGANTASVLLGTGTGAFGPKTDYATGGGTVGVALGDVNGDGRPDLVTANQRANPLSVSVLLGTGTGAFGPKTDYPTGDGPNDVALGDVNGDGQLDVVTVSAFPGTAVVLLGTGGGAFAPPTRFTAGSLPYNGVLGDVNGDGRPDLVTADNGSSMVSVLLNTGTFLGARAGLAAAGGGLYPNPVTSAGFTVRLPAGAGAAGAEVRLELVNTRGQVVRRQVAAVPAAGAGLAVEAAGLPAGVYALRLHVGGRVLTQRLVLQ